MWGLSCAPVIAGRSGSSVQPTARWSLETNRWDSQLLVVAIAQASVYTLNLRRPQSQF
jgi:hypothetical protein